MKNIYFILSIVFAAIIFSSCSSSNNQIKTTKLPMWFLNPVSNNANYIYGTGQGSSIKEAKTNALSNMSQSLIVKVNSTINTKTTSSTNSYNKTTTKNINIQAKDIEFTNYKVKKAIQSNNSFFVLLSVNRDQLFIENKKRLDLINTKIDLVINNLTNYSKLEQINQLEILKPTIKKAKDLASILYAINNNFDYQTYHMQYDNYINQIDELKNSISIKLSSNTKNTLYKEYLKQLLNKNSYKITQNNQDVTINISNNISYSIARRWQIAKVSTTLNVIANNKTISTNTINTIGRSSSTKQNALKSSAKEFKKKLAIIGLNKILFNK